MRGPARADPNSPSPPEPSDRSPVFRRLLIAAKSRPGASPFPRLVRELARPPGTTVTLCHVVMRATSAAGNEVDGSPANPTETAIVQELRAAIVTLLGRPGQDVPIKILHGDPGERICEYAEYLDSDLIVLGPRLATEGSLRKALRGSVSKYVVGNSRRNVLVAAD